MSLSLYPRCDRKKFDFEGPDLSHHRLGTVSTLRYTHTHTHTQPPPTPTFHLSLAASLQAGMPVWKIPFIAGVVVPGVDGTVEQKKRAVVAAAW